MLFALFCLGQHKQAFFEAKARFIAAQARPASPEVTTAAAALPLGAPSADLVDSDVSDEDGGDDRDRDRDRDSDSDTQNDSSSGEAQDNDANANAGEPNSYGVVSPGRGIHSPSDVTSHTTTTSTSTSTRLESEAEMEARRRARRERWRAERERERERDRQAMLTANDVKQIVDAATKPLRRMLEQLLSVCEANSDKLDAAVAHRDKMTQQVRVGGWD